MSGLVLWFTGLSGAGKSTIAELVGGELERAGVAVVVSAISPYDEARRRSRALVERHGTFVLVHVATSLEECERRDPKGLYAKAHSGEITEFTGVSDPYEAPEAPELRVETESRSPEDSARDVLAYIEGVPA